MHNREEEHAESILALNGGRETLLAFQSYTGLDKISDGDRGVT